MATVPPGHRGVLTTFGRPNEKIYPEGIHFKVPLADKMNLVDVSIQKVEGDGEAASKDLPQKSSLPSAQKCVMKLWCNLKNALVDMVL